MVGIQPVREAAEYWLIKERGSHETVNFTLFVLSYDKTPFNMQVDSLKDSFFL